MEKCYIPGVIGKRAAVVVAHVDNPFRVSIRCSYFFYNVAVLDVCENKDPLCDPQPGQMGYPPYYCSDSKYGPPTQKLCPKMCNICQGQLMHRQALNVFHAVALFTPLSMGVRIKHGVFP